MITVKYNDRIWELVLTKHSRLILRMVIDNSYWLPIENSLGNRLDGLKIKTFDTEEKMIKYAVKVEKKYRDYFNMSEIIWVHRGKEVIKYE